MALLDIFKKKKIPDESVEKKPEKKKIEKEKKPSFVSVKKTKPSVVKSKKISKEETKKEPGKIEKAGTETIQQKKNVSDRAYRVLRAPHISEKATNLSENNKYVFKVKPRANKVEIRKAIKDVYGVEAVAIKIINIHRKKRKLGKQIGWRKGYKKAIVKVKEGQKIELLSR